MIILRILWGVIYWTFYILWKILYGIVAIAFYIAIGIIISLWLDTLRKGSKCD